MADGYGSGGSRVKGAARRRPCGEVVTLRGSEDNEFWETTDLRQEDDHGPIYRARRSYAKLHDGGDGTAPLSIPSSPSSGAWPIPDSVLPEADARHSRSPRPLPSPCRIRRSASTVRRSFVAGVRGWAPSSTTLRITSPRLPAQVAGRSTPSPSRHHPAARQVSRHTTWRYRIALRC